MQSAITGLLDNLASLLGPLSPFTKAIVPAVLALATAAVKSIANGHIDKVSLTIAASGLVLALVTYLLPNKRVKKAKPKPVPVAPKPPAAK